MPPEISLLRHGATIAGNRYCGSIDVPLSAEGWQQLWRAVEGRRWNRILSSPLQRCSAFAGALAMQLAIPCSTDPRWRELYFGDWEGRSAEELMASAPRALAQFWQDPVRYPPPNAERLSALRERVLQAWSELAARESDERWLVVTHGGPMRVILAERAGQALESLSNIEVAHAQLIDLLAVSGGTFVDASRGTAAV